MKPCEWTIERLDDYADRDLSESEARDIELHLAACDDCRQEWLSLQALLRDAAALPRRIQPERDLWIEVAPQLRRGPLSVIDFSRHARTTLYAMAVAAAVVVAVSLGLMQPAPVPSAHPVAPVAANPAVPEPFEDDRAVLRAAYQVRADALDPTLRSVIDSNLSIIHESVDEIRMAMEMSPDNPRLEQMLMTACLSEVEMLRQFVHSSNEG